MGKKRDRIEINFCACSNFMYCLFIWDFCSKASRKKDRKYSIQKQSPKGVL